jgi:outer membrane protein assembly factor BamB
MTWMSHPALLSAVALLWPFLCACSDAGGAHQVGTREAAPARAGRAPGPGAQDAAVEPGTWPGFRGDRGLTGVAPGALAADYAVRWTYAAGDSIVSSPVVAHGTVFIGCDDYALHAIDLASGERRWTFPTEDIIEAPPLVVGDTVYVGSSDFFVYAVNAHTGELRWKFEADDRVLGSCNWVPAPHGDGAHVLFGSYDTRVYCLDGDDGSVVWKFETEDQINGAPAIWGDRVVFGGCDSVLHQVSATTGASLRDLPMGDRCQIAGSAAIEDGNAYFGHYGNAFVAVDLETNALRWEYTSNRDGFFSSPAIGTELVVFGGRDRQLHCARKSDGAPVWTFKTRRNVDASPVICGDKVVFGAGDGWVHVLRLEDGAPVWSYEIGRPVFSSPAVVDGVIVIGASDGSVYAFQPQEDGK